MFTREVRYFQRYYLIYWIGLAVVVSWSISFKSYAQSTLTTHNKVGFNGFPTLPYTIPIHPMGAFTLRLPMVSALPTSEKSSFSIQTSGGNVWLPPLYIYVPTLISEEQKMLLTKMPFHHRLPVFQSGDFPRDTLRFEADGVIRSYRLNFRQQITDRHFVGLVINGHLLTGGRSTLNYFLSDGFIEWLHSRVVNQEDPFSRKQFPLDMAKVAYTDERGESFNWNEGETLLTSIELQHIYRVLNSTENLNNFLNISSHLFIPTSKVQPYLSFGLGIHLGHQFIFKQKHALVFMLNANIIGQRLLKLRDGVVPLNRPYNYGVDGYFGYTKQGKKYKFSIGLQLLNQSSLQDGSDMKKNFELTAFENNKDLQEPIRWGHQAGIALFSMQQNWNLILMFENQKNGFGFYIQEDFWVNNAPDFQIGFLVKRGF